MGCSNQVVRDGAVTRMQHRGIEDAVNVDAPLRKS